MDVPSGKSMRARATSPAFRQTHSNWLFITAATSGFEKSTLLAMRALVQQKAWSNSPNNSNRSTGRPVAWEAKRAASTPLACHSTKPAETRVVSGAGCTAV
jgi:hypothetical protein